MNIRYLDNFFVIKIPKDILMYYPLPREFHYITINKMILLSDQFFF